MKGAVLLDLDGTLIDSRPGIVESHHAAIRALGHEPDPAVDLTFAIGPPLDDVIGLVLAHYGETRSKEGADAYRTYYERRGYLGSVLYPGVREAVGALRAEGHALFVATSKRRVPAVMILEHLGLAPLLDGIYGSEPGGAIDHKPELIAHVLSREGITPGRAVMVGDRRYDIAGAHANGLRAIGALWGYGTREELEAAGADGLAASVDALPDAVRSVMRG
ncbi:HAD hydrolase-like protein [Roseomonas sp. CCTCC AB2023176]|uniref:HAD hydrolase-like protein n=1 Tax=Roseomonas sp. CCTCC AB2023176 TaxID=3342640 RepID=UPI0035D666DF